MEDNDPQLLDEAMRLCNEVARQVREANTYYRNHQRHVSKAGEYGAGLAELCAERIGRLQAIRRGGPEPEPKALGRLFLANSKPSNAELSGAGGFIARVRVERRVRGQKSAVAIRQTKGNK